jgi:hypothetical protein
MEITADKLLVKMANDLKRYAQSNSARPDVVKAKEAFMLSWSQVVGQYEQQIEMLENDAEKMMGQLIRMKNFILKLEAICFIHGIDDLPMWMAKNFDALVDDVRIGQSLNMVQFPSRLLENAEWRKVYDEKMNELTNDSTDAN